ncbi:ferrochelatase [Membranihabitans maritimus]|uniref:ferrochelatase n=1 Tax=Membranihabitans maritimus TaxID=2904244 RepID=UPI001F0119A3|nr:ferrochelatase [Membranihabitans maritimus]
MEEINQVEKKAKTGVALVNLGTPDSTRVSDVRKYLTQFLLDARVIDIPEWNRQLLVRGSIAPFRAPKSAAEYKKLWTEEGSPIKIFGYGLRDKLQKRLGEEYVVSLGMRYQSPSVEESLDMLFKENVSRVIVIPLFPQYASATVGSVIEEVMKVVRSNLTFPQLNFVNKFYDRKDFIDAWTSIGNKYDLEKYDKIIFSYHGIPQRQLFKADTNNICKANGHCCQEISGKNQFCYSAQCFHNTRLLINSMGLDSEKCITTFQSRLGRSEWTQPYTEATVERLAVEGYKKVLIFSPAFVADCLETTVELGMEYRDLFLENGGEVFDMVESLNVAEPWVDVLENMVREY